MTILRKTPSSEYVFPDEQQRDGDVVADRDEPAPSGWRGHGGEPNRKCGGTDKKNSPYDRKSARVDCEVGFECSPFGARKRRYKRFTPSSERSRKQHGKS